MKGNDVRSMVMPAITKVFSVFIVSIWLSYGASGYRIISAASPGMAGEDPFEGKPPAPERSVFLYGFHSIG